LLSIEAATEGNVQVDNYGETYMWMNWTRFVLLKFTSCGKNVSLWRHISPLY